TEAALGPRPGATEANLKRIRPGMTGTEVQALLGGAPQDKYPYPREGEMGLICIWDGDGGTGDIVVVFREGRVLRAHWWRLAWPRETFPPSILARPGCCVG